MLQTLKNFFAKIYAHLIDIHSEPGTSTLSWGRCAGSLALLASIVWVTLLCVHNWQMPSLEGVTGLVVAPYSANKVGTAIQSFSK